MDIRFNIHSIIQWLKNINIEVQMGIKWCANTTNFTSVQRYY